MVQRDFLFWFLLAIKNKQTIKQTKTPKARIKKERKKDKGKRKAVLCSVGLFTISVSWKKTECRGIDGLVRAGARC